MTAANPAPPDGLSARLRLRRGDFALSVELAAVGTGITGVFGPSGGGKSSLLRALAGLEPDTRGELRVAGEVWQDDARGILLAAHRRAVGMVFQSPRLFPHLNVRDNLRYGLTRRGERPGLALEEVVRMLALGPLLERDTRGLSGGESQRVAIGRAALCGPRVLLLDEPLSALDASRRSGVLPFVEALQRRLGVPALYVSHNLDELVRLCETLLVIEEGQVRAAGPLGDVLASMPVALLRGDAAGVALEARVVGYDPAWDLTEVAADRLSLQLPGEVGSSGETARVHILARDVGLSAVVPRESSLLNFCAVRVEQVLDPVSGTSGVTGSGAGAFVIVRCRAGDDVILARITRRSRELLNVEPGRELFAQIKSAAVRSA